MEMVFPRLLCVRGIEESDEGVLEAQDDVILARTHCDTATPQCGRHSVLDGRSSRLLEIDDSKLEEKSA